MLPARLSVVMVTHDCREALARTLPALLSELRAEDELVIVDNASRDGTPGRARALAPAARVIEAGANLGFAAGCNLGAERARGDLLLLLNPDAAPAPGFREAIELPLRERRGWSAWMALVSADGGASVNTSGGVVHFTGIAWAGQAGAPLARAGSEPREVAFASGACLAVPAEVWRRHGGMSAPYFMYHEDVDFSLRLWLAGERVGIEPRARVDHDYEFEKGALKWRMLERNRWATLLRVYPGSLLALLAPALLATELALAPAALLGGWWGAKAAAWGDTMRALPRLLRERRAIQAGRRIAPRELARLLVAEPSSAYLGRMAGSAPLRLALRAYWMAVRALLASGARGGGASAAPR